MTWSLRGEGQLVGSEFDELSTGGCVYRVSLDPSHIAPWFRSPSVCRRRKARSPQRTVAYRPNGRQYGIGTFSGTSVLRQMTLANAISCRKRHNGTSCTSLHVRMETTELQRHKDVRGMHVGI